MEQLETCRQHQNKAGRYLDKYRRYNCIKLHVKSPEDEVIKKEIFAVLDTGNNLQYTAMSSTIFEELKRIKILPKAIPLNRTHVEAASVGGDALYIKGVLNHDLTFNTESDTKIEFSKFYVIENLVNDLNIGKLQLDRLDTKWFFKRQAIWIKDTRLRLHLPKDSRSEESLQSVKVLK